MVTSKICNNSLEAHKENIINTLGYEFKDESFLLLSLIHSSYRRENQVNIDNEKLEFIGDAVLDLIVSNFLFKNTEYSKNEGDLTVFRSKIVKEESLYKFAKKINLSDFIIVSASGRYMKIEENVSVLADSFEALVGAIYLDSDFETTYEVIVNYFCNDFIDILNSEDQNFKGLINEYAIKNSLDKPLYEVIKINGPVHDRTYTCSIKLEGKFLGSGSGHSIKKAEQKAAKLALINLGLNHE